MRKLTQPVTADVLLEMSCDGVLRELVRGELREMPPAGGTHGETTVNLQTEIHNFVRSRRLGRVFAAETGFLVERDPDTVLAPDCAFVRADRMPVSVERYVPVVPDLVVETISPGDRSRSIRQKTADWLRAGVRLVWVLDPGLRMVTVHVSGQPPEALGADGLLDGGDVLPGFSVELARIWPGEL